MSEGPGEMPVVDDADRISARLVERFQGGDLSAFRRLHEQHERFVAAYLMSVLKNRHDAEDVAQQVFLKVFQALPAYRTDRPFRHWLVRVTHNAAVDHIRRNQRAAPVSPRELDDRRDYARTCVDDEPPAWGTAAAVHAAIDDLPLAQQQVLVLLYRCDLDSRLAATVLGRSEVSVRKLRSRALHGLHQALQPVGAGVSR